MILAIPLVFFGLAALFLSLVPALVRGGAFNGKIESALSEALGGRVSVREADVPEGSLFVLRGVAVEEVPPYLGPVEVAEVRVRFGAVFPFGGLREIVLDRPRIRLDITSDRVRRLMASKEGRGGSDFQLRLRGPIEVPSIRLIEGEVRGELEGRPYRVEGLAAAFIPGKGGTFLPFGVKGTIVGARDGVIDIEGALELTRENGRVALTRGKIGSLSLDFGAESLRVSTGSARLSLKPFEMSAELAALFESLTGILFKGFVATDAALEVDGDRVTRVRVEGYLEKLEATNPDYRVSPGRVLMEGRPVEGGWRTEGTLKNAEIALTTGLKVRAETLAVRSELRGARLTGKADFEKAELTLEDLEGENLKGTVDFDVVRRDRIYQGKVKLALVEAEIRKGIAYQEFRGKPLELVLDGTFDFGKRVYDFDGTGFSVGGVGSAEVRGHLEEAAGGPVYRFEVVTSDLQMKELAQRAGDWAPGLRATGGAQARITVQGAGRARLLHGRIRVNNVDATWGPLSAKGLKGEIPFCVSEGDPPGSRAPQEGTVEWADLSLKDLSTGAQTQRIVAEPNLIRVGSGLNLPLWGGRGRIGGVVLRDYAGAKLRMETSLEIADMGLGGFTAALGAKKMIEGVAQASFPRVEISPDRMTFEGGASARVWGGELELRDFAILYPLEPRLTAFRAWFEARGVHLKDVSRQATDFGLMTGIVDGRGTVEIFNDGWPQEMEVELQADPKAGGKLDLRAVRSLAILAEGSDATAREIEKLPRDELRYSRLGFYARLHPDGSLSLRGKYYVSDGTSAVREYTLEELKRGYAEPRADEYIMTAGGFTFSRINVLNTPGRRIDFKDVVDRIRARKAE